MLLYCLCAYTALTRELLLEVLDVLHCGFAVNRDYLTARHLIKEYIPLSFRVCVDLDCHAKGIRGQQPLILESF